MDIQEKYDDLYNLIQNLEMTIKETDFEDVKEDLRQVLYWAEVEIKDAEEELEEKREAEWKREADERYEEYREMVGF